MPLLLKSFFEPRPQAKQHLAYALLRSAASGCNIAYGIAVPVPLQEKKFLLRRKFLNKFVHRRGKLPPVKLSFHAVRGRQRLVQLAENCLQPAALLRAAAAQNVQRKIAGYSAEIGTQNAWAAWRNVVPRRKPCVVKALLLILALIQNISCHRAAIA